MFGTFIDKYYHIHLSICSSYLISQLVYEVGIILLILEIMFQS